MSKMASTQNADSSRLGTSVFQHALVQLDDEGNIVEWSCAQCGETAHSAKAMSVHLQTHRLYGTQKCETEPCDTVAPTTTMKPDFSDERGQGDGPHKNVTIVVSPKPSSGGNYCLRKRTRSTQENPQTTIHSFESLQAKISNENQTASNTSADADVPKSEHITPAKQDIQSKRQLRRRKLGQDLRYGLPVILSSNKRVKTDVTKQTAESTNFENSLDQSSTSSEPVSKDSSADRAQDTDSCNSENQDVAKRSGNSCEVPALDVTSEVEVVVTDDNSGTTKYKCSSCDWQTPRHFRYHRHLLTHSQGSQIECNYCCNTIGMFISKSNTVEKEHKCSRCARTFSRRPLLQKHMQEEHGESGTAKFVCFICLEPFEKIQGLKIHFGECHQQELNDDPKLRAFQQDPQRTTINERGDELICSFCNWKSDRHFNYHRHVLRHCLSTQNYVCPYCCKHIMPENSTSSYGVSTFTCSECSHVCYTKCHLATHLYQEHGINQTGPLICAVCNYRCATKKHLEKHHNIAHEGQDFVLNETTVEALKNMQQPATDSDGNAVLVRDYTCEVCGFTCNRHDTLKKHAIAHVPEQHRTVFKCTEEGCGFETYSEISLNVHISGKHKRQERAKKRNELAVIYACDLCGHFNTPFEEQLFTHQATTCLRNSADKPEEEVKKDKLRAKKTRAPPGFCIKYSCSQCKFTAARRWNMLRHKETAHGESEEVTCDYCNYRTKHRKLLMNHYTKAHLMELPQKCDELIKSSEEPLGQNLRGVYTVCPPRDTVPMKQKGTQAVHIATCRECGKCVPSTQLRKHMAIVHQQIKTYRCHVPQCDYTATTAGMLSSHMRRRHVAHLAGYVTYKQGLQYYCVWQCGYVTTSRSAWHQHNREICRLRDSTKSWTEYELLCKEQEQDTDINLADSSQLTPADDKPVSEDVLSTAMQSISEITRAMKASGIDKPVIHQQGKTIYITVDKEDILKKRLKDKLLSLNKESVDSNRPDQMLTHIQYIIKTGDEKNAEFEDIESLVSLSHGSVENSSTMENSQFLNNPVDNCNVLDDVIRANSQTVDPSIVEKTQTIESLLAGDLHNSENKVLVESVQNPPNTTDLSYVKNLNALSNSGDIRNVGAETLVTKRELETGALHLDAVKEPHSDAIFLPVNALNANEAGIVVNKDETSVQEFDQAVDRPLTHQEDQIQQREVMTASLVPENEQTPSLIVEKGDSSWTIYSTDDTGETVLYQIQGDLELSDNGELAPEIQHLLAAAIDKT